MSDHTLRLSVVLRTALLLAVSLCLLPAAHAAKKSAPKLSPDFLGYISQIREAVNSLSGIPEISGQDVKAIGAALSKIEKNGNVANPTGDKPPADIKVQDEVQKALDAQANAVQFIDKLPKSKRADYDTFREQLTVIQSKLEDIKKNLKPEAQDTPHADATATAIPTQVAVPIQSTEQKPENNKPAEDRLSQLLSLSQFPFLLPVSLGLNLIAIVLLLWIWLGPLVRIKASQEQNRQELRELNAQASSLERQRSELENKIAVMKDRQKSSAASAFVPTLIAHEPLKEEPIDILKDPTPSGHKSKHEREMARAAREDEAVVVAPKDSFTGRPWDDYNIARGMEQSAGEAWFFSHYPNHLSLSCLNLEQARNQHVALRFECSNRGVFLAIRHSETYLVFPHLSDNFLSARKSLEGVFSYPDSTSGSLKLKRPARVIEGQRGEFTLTDAGVINHG